MGACIWRSESSDWSGVVAVTASMISSGVVVVGSAGVVVGKRVGVVVVEEGPLLKVKEVGVGAAGVVKAKVGGVGVMVAVVVDGGGNEEVAHGVVVGKVKGWAVVAPPNGVEDVEV